MPPLKSRKRSALRASKFASEAKKLKCDNSNIQNPISDNRDHTMFREKPATASVLVSVRGNSCEPILVPSPGGVVRGKYKGKSNKIKISQKITTTVTQVTKKKGEDEK